MAADRSDPQIRALIGRSNAGSFSELAADIASIFGGERAWPVEWVSAVHRELRPHGRARRSRFLDDPAISEFIGDRGGLMSLDALLAAGIAQFGRDRFPSRSHLDRLKAQIWAARAKAAPTS